MKLGYFFLFLLTTSLYAESQLSKRYVVDKRLLGGKDLSDLAAYKDNFKEYSTKQPAFMYEQREIEGGDTNYFTISGSTQTQEQNDVLEKLEKKGVITLIDTLEIISEDGHVVDTIHTDYARPHKKDWSKVEISTP